MLEILAVIGLFLIRIGIPVLVLFTIGMLVERAYSRRETAEERVTESA